MLVARRTDLDVAAGLAVVCACAWLGGRTHLEGMKFALAHGFMGSERVAGSEILGAVLGGQVGLFIGTPLVAFWLFAFDRLWSSEGAFSFSEVLAWVGWCHVPLLGWSLLVAPVMTVGLSTIAGASVVFRWSNSEMEMWLLPLSQAMFAGRVCALLAGAYLLTRLFARRRRISSAQSAMFVVGAVTTTYVLGLVISF